MNENLSVILPVHNSEGKKTVSARQLYDFLGLDKSNWAKWYRVNILKNKFAIEGVDYLPLVLGTNVNKTPNVDFEITTDFAKRIAMMANTPKGEEARNYFLECEKAAQQTMNQPAVPENLSPLQLIAHMATQMDGEVKRLEAKIDNVVAKQTTAPDDYYAIAGYATLRGRKIDVKMAAKLGKKAVTLCNQLGYFMGSIPDPRFGKVRLYPKDVLESVFSEEFGDSGLKVVK